MADNINVLNGLGGNFADSGGYGGGAPWQQANPMSLAGMGNQMDAAAYQNQLNALAQQSTPQAVPQAVPQAEPIRGTGGEDIASRFKHLEFE